MLNSTKAKHEFLSGLAVVLASVALFALSSTIAAAFAGSFQKLSREATNGLAFLSLAVALVSVQSVHKFLRSR